MKRSEMLELIKQSIEVLSGVSSTARGNPEKTLKECSLEEKILSTIEKAGMQPPRKQSNNFGVTKSSKPTKYVNKWDEE